MSVDYHRHCQQTVLSANGTGAQNGSTWTLIGNLELSNLVSNWKSYFTSNRANITQDLAAILQLIDNTAQLVGGNGISITDIDIDNGRTLNLKQATSSELGGIKIGYLETATKRALKLDGNGKAYVEISEAYSLPTMSSTVKGGAKLGSGLAMSGETLSVNDSNFVHTTGNETAAGNKTFTGNVTLKGDSTYNSTNLAMLSASPNSQAEGHEIVDANWVRQVMQAKESTVLTQWVSSSGSDDNDGLTSSKAKKTIDKAMEVLNSYRLSSATGVNITLGINGTYDIYKDNNGKTQPTIAHADAVNQNNLAISGATPTFNESDKSGGIQLTSTLTSSQTLNDYSWYLLLGTSAGKLAIKNIKIGFPTNSNVTGTTLTVFNSPYSILYLNNVEICGKLTHLMNESVDPQRVEFQNFVAIKTNSLNIGNMNTVNFIFLASNGTAKSLTDTTDFTLSGTPVLILKDVSVCPNNITIHKSSPTVGYKRKCIIILDNVTCQISTDKPGYKSGYTNGTEYYADIYCINGTNIETVLPNTPKTNGAYGDTYNIVHTSSDASAAPSWYNPNWDVIS